jgi:alpha-N-acetylglucosamine transferase
MRRLRSLVAATLLLIGTYYIFVQHSPELQIAYHPWSSHASPAGSDHGSPTTEDTPAPSDDSWSTPPIDVEANPTLDFPSENPSPGEIPLAEPLNLPPPSDPIPPAEDVPSIPPSELSPPEQPPQDVNSNSPPPLSPEYPFQSDLALELPVDILKQYTSHKPHNYFPGGLKQSVYATFMATHNPSIKDPYYLAIHSLIYRVLYSQRSRTQKYPFIVFVAEHVTEEQRQLLAGAGAVVRELESVEWPGDGEGVQERWKTLFAKLNMWSQTEFEKILFLDADAFPVANIDPMFDLATPQNCVEERLTPDDVLADGTKVCEPYIFAGVTQSPFDSVHPNINVGSLVFTPSTLQHQRLMQNYQKTGSFDVHMAEQAFLNWQFDPQGAYPPTILEREWGGFFPSDDEEGKLKIIHEKLWHEERGWLKAEWEGTWVEMCGFYGGEEFVAVRNADGIAELPTNQT